MSISTQIALIVGSIVLCSAAFLGYHSLRAANEVLRREAIDAIASTANVRIQLLLSKLAASKTRTRSILQMSDGICSSGKTEMRSCLTGVFGHFLRTTEAAGVQFYPLHGEVISVGLPADTFAVIPSPQKEQLARFGRGRDGLLYVQVQATTEKGEIRAQFPIEQIQSIFSARDGLGATGEAFLTDASGYFLTATDYNGPIGHSEPIAATPIVRCLSGASGESLGPDFRNVEKVHAFRPVNEIGGGCIMANIAETEAFAKSAALTVDVLKIGFITLVVAVLMALLAARRLTVPIQRLVDRAESLEKGDYDSKPEIDGPREIRTFAKAFSKMTASLLEEIADRKRAEKQLSQAIRSRDEFLATLSHELRTPMNIILGWIEILKTDGRDAGTFQQATDTLARNAHLQKNLIDDLLDVSRIINGKFEVNFENMDFGTLVKNVAESLVPTAEKKGISVKISVPQLAIRLRADQLKLSQVVTNIFQNALKFTPPGGTIEVSVFCENQSVKMAIRDTGIGIDAAFLPEVFERLKQEDMATTRSHSGLGLGLAICRHIVEQHEGSIAVRSEGRGKGSTFVVDLPLQCAGTAQIDLPENSSEVLSPPILTQPSQQHVLIVDDSLDNLVLLRFWLEEAGFIVSEAANANDALTVLQSEKPDVLLSDIGMPIEDGYELLHKIRQLPGEMSEIPAIALTAYAREEEKSRAVEAGFQLHIPKPTNKQAVLTAVRSIARIDFQL